MSEHLESEWLGYQEAADMLGVCTRTLARYAKRGWLERHRHGRKVLFHRSDVLTVVRRRRGKRVQAKVAAAHIGELAERWGLVELVLDEQRGEVKFDDEALRSLYESAVAFPTTGWPPGLELDLLRLLLRLRTTDLNRLRDLGVDQVPWRPLVSVLQRVPDVVMDSSAGPLVWAARAHVLRLASAFIASEKGRRATRRSLRDASGYDRSLARRVARRQAQRPFPNRTVADSDAAIRAALRDFQARRQSTQPDS